MKKFILNFKSWRVMIWKWSIMTSSNSGPMYVFLLSVPTQPSSCLFYSHFYSPFIKKRFNLIFKVKGKFARSRVDSHMYLQIQTHVLLSDFLLRGQRPHCRKQHTIQVRHSGISYSLMMSEKKTQWKCKKAGCNEMQKWRWCNCLNATAWMQRRERERERGVGGRR